MTNVYDAALTPEEERAMLQGFIEQGLSNKEIAKRYGIDASNISRKLKKYGLVCAKFKNAKCRKGQFQQPADQVERPQTQVDPPANEEGRSRKKGKARKTPIVPPSSVVAPPPITEEILTNPQKLQSILLSLSIQQMMTSQDSKWASVLLTLLDKTNALQKQPEQEVVVKYRRPTFLNEKQCKIIDTIVYSKKKIIMIEGDQRTGKSTCIWVALGEFVLNHDHFVQVDLMTGKGEQSERILRDLMKDQLLLEFNDNMISSYIKTKAVYFHKGSRIDTHETTVSDIKGSDAHLIWIDELDVAIKQSPEAVMSAIFVLRARKDLKCILSANMDKGAYLLLRDTLQKEEFRDDIEFVTLTKADSPHLQDTNNDVLLECISNAIVGEDFTQRRLHNVSTADGDMFDPAALRDAFETYAMFMVQCPTIERCILAIDPSGTGHKWGWFLGAFNRGVFWEMESGEIQMGMPDESGQKWSPERMEAFFMKFVRAHGAEVVIESNSGGGIMKTNLALKGARVTSQNFGSDNDVNSRSAYIQRARRLLDERVIVLRNQTLHSQLLIYAPTVKSEDRFKGDLADAFLHFCWRAVYLSNHNKKFEFINEDKGNGF